MLIANRVLKLRNERSEVDVSIRIYAPVQESETAWSCAYEIDWPHGRWAHAAWGVDAVQALLIALQLIGSDIYASEYHAQGRLIFDEAGKGYGFPVPKGIRDLLVGDDAKFF